MVIRNAYSIVCETIRINVSITHLKIRLDYVKKITVSMLLIILCFNTIPAFASFTQQQLSSPVGYWLMIDDKANKPRAVIKIYPVRSKKGTTLSGKFILGLYIPGRNWSKYCKGCVAPWTNKPIQNMTFIWGFQKSGNAWDSPWINGKIFDIESDKDIYSSKIWLTHGGRQLKVRGYLFVFFRTQTWMRLTRSQVRYYMALYKRQVKQHPLSI